MVIRLAFIICALVLYKNASADIRDPLDPFDTFQDDSTDDARDDEKTADELIQDAIILQQDDRPLDARTKLLKALSKDPRAFRAHILLADYYLRHVGHFRLALNYVKQAQALFEAEYKKPPYSSDPIAQSLHGDLLNLLSQARLNLDDYQGALDALNDFESYGYYAEWLPSSKSWILMKLGRLDEAIKIARIGMLVGSNPGSTLNVLGILLSMTGERQGALDIFKQAIKYEMSLGELGRPATPLNNSGEVYNEIFQEDKARDAWVRAMKLPDGCEHVLPSLNLTFLLIGQLDLVGAKEAMDTFESCVAQFPLRNGEEHKALVHLARGRIALYAGDLKGAVDHFESALARTQWFGKIGTSQDDLKAAVMVSLGIALRKLNAHKKFERYRSTWEWAKALKLRSVNRFRSWWLLRRAREVLTENLSNMEDLFVRHTDSMLDYAALGEVLAPIPPYLLRDRINHEREQDKRSEAAPYYDSYLAENYIEHSWWNDARTLLKNVLSLTRPLYDNALKLRALTLSLQYAQPNTREYADTAYQIFQLSRAELRNEGYRLPVLAKISDRSVRDELEQSAFEIHTEGSYPYTIAYQFQDGQHVLEFDSDTTAIGDIRVKADNLYSAINNLADSVFMKDLK